LHCFPTCCYGDICQCEDGANVYSVNGTNCIDVNECLVNNGGCEDQCINTAGSYYCQCNSFSYAISSNGHDCEDINECDTNPSACPFGNICVNTWGKYHCLEGEPITPTAPPSGCTNGIVDVVFLVDSSGSIRDRNPIDGRFDNWDVILEYVVSIVDALDVRQEAVRVGMVTFSLTARHEFYLNTFYDKEEMKAKIRSTPYMGAFTNTQEGLEYIKEGQFISGRGDRPSVPNVVVVITDGESNMIDGRLNIQTAPAITVETATELQQSGVNIIAIGIGDTVNYREIRGIASPPKVANEDWFQVTTYRDLNAIVEELREQIFYSCDQVMMLAMRGMEVQVTTSAGLAGSSTATMIIIAVVMSLFNFTIVVTLFLKYIRKRRMHTQKEQRILEDLDKILEKDTWSCSEDTSTLRSFSVLSGSSQYSKQADFRLK